MQARTALGVRDGNNSVRMRALSRLRDESVALDLVYEMGDGISAFEAAELRVATAGSLWDSNEVRRDALVQIEVITGVEICFFDESYAVLKPGDSFNFVTTNTKRKLTIYTVEPSIKVIPQTTARRGWSTEFTNSELTTTESTIADVYLALQLVGSGADPSTLALASSTPNTTGVPNRYRTAYEALLTAALVIWGRTQLVHDSDIQVSPRDADDGELPLDQKPDL